MRYLGIEKRGKNLSWIHKKFI